MSSGPLTRRELLRGRLARKVLEPSAASEPAARSEPAGGSAASPAHCAGTVEPPALPRVIAWLQEPEAAPPRAAPRAIALHRPPGALAEDEFLARCTRCGRCADVCAPRAIRLAPPRFREAAGTPWIDALAAPCRMCEDTPCVAVCEPGALQLEGAGPMGTAHVLELDCLNRLGSPCTTCSEHCPVPGAIQHAGSLPVVDARLCSGCGICAHVCPAPGRAIALLPARIRHRARGPGGAEAPRHE